MSVPMAPLFTVATVERETVLPSEMPTRVSHFSIPVLEATGGPEDQASDEIASQKIRLRGGEVLVSRLNPRKARVLLVPASLETYSVASTEFVAVRPGETLEPRFLAYLLGSGKVTDELDAQVRSVTRSHQRVEPEVITSLRIPIYPLDVQRRIADFLDDQVTRIDKAIQLRQKQIGLVQESADATVAEVILGGGRQISARPWFVDVPTNRRLQPLRAQWRVVDCKHRTPDYLDDGIPVISPGDISPGDLDLSIAHRFVGEADYLDLADQLRRCRPGDLVYSRNASAGTAAFVNTDRPFTMGQDVCRITSLNENQRFLFHVLNNIVLPQLDSVRVGSTFTRINVDQIKALTIPVPPSSEQLEIASKCDSVRDVETGLVARLESSASLLKERKRSLITAAVTGEFDVSSASVRAAGVATSGVQG